MARVSVGVLSRSAGQTPSFAQVGCFSPLLMTVLLMKVSGAALLEKSLAENKPGYREYMEQTSAFIPRKPRRR